MPEGLDGPLGGWKPGLCSEAGVLGHRALGPGERDARLRHCKHKSLLRFDSVQLPLPKLAREEEEACVHLSE